MTRRQILRISGAAACAAGNLAFPLALPGSAAHDHELARESMRGYRRVLGEEWKDELFFPALQSNPPQLHTAVSALPRRVVVENGFGFSPDDQSRPVLQQWSAQFGHGIGLPRAALESPYIRFTWPAPLMIRHYGAVTPVDAPESAVIGRVGSTPVAFRKAIGNRELVYLGSPLGPVLLSGDPDSWKLARMLAGDSSR